MKTLQGNTYVVTARGTDCTVSAVLDDGERCDLITVPAGAQGCFVAISEEVSLSSEDAIVTRGNFRLAIGGGGGAGGEHVDLSGFAKLGTSQSFSERNEFAKGAKLLFEGELAGGVALDTNYVVNGSRVTLVNGAWDAMGCDLTPVMSSLSAYNNRLMSKYQVQEFVSRKYKRIDGLVAITPEVGGRYFGESFPEQVLTITAPSTAGRNRDEDIVFQLMIPSGGMSLVVNGVRAFGSVVPPVPGKIYVMVLWLSPLGYWLYKTEVA